MKRVIVNGLTGNSWRFKQFEGLNISMINKVETYKDKIKFVDFVTEVVNDTDKLGLDYEEDTDKIFFRRQPTEARYVFKFLQKNDNQSNF